jgi:putative membrane protein
MPSEQRLHPVSILFALGGTLKALALPALLLLFTSSRTSGGPGRAFGMPQGNWELWAVVLLIPATAVAVAKYLSFRMRYDENELVIRTGILFRNERHVPYARIQNLDAVRNLFHRLLGVTEVRVETGSGKEAEATISVLPVEAFEEMRRRVFEARVPRHEPEEAPPDVEAPVSAPPSDRTLLRLPVSELVLHGIIENRTFLVAGAVFGLLWELGLVEAVGDRLFGDASYGRGLVREVIAALAAGNLPVVRILITVAVAAAALAALQIASIAWTIVRLHGFRLTRTGEDLRTEFGLFTRVTGTIPLRRIQTLTIREGPLQRLVSRVGVRIETAGGTGGGSGAATQEREWVAPILRRTVLPDFAREILPELDLATIEWRPVHPRAFRRAIKGGIAGAIGLSLSAGIVVGWPAATAVLVIALPWTAFATRMHVRHLGWAANDDVVMFRSGWVWRRVTVARVVKIQAVTVLQSPFDRRTGMGSVRVDTAGATERSHRVHVPYLPWDVAVSVQQGLASRAAGTVFRW